MPIISKFYGILIRMFYKDHAPPHFHAVYAEHELIVGLNPIRILEGEAPARVRSMVLHHITNVIPEPNHKLRLTYSNGETVIVDFIPFIQTGGVFTPLKDPAFFSKVKLGEGGRYIEWPGEIDFCADALWLEAHEGHEAA